jgi:hypothetical protein
MGGFNAYPALDIRPPVPIDPLGDYAKVQQIKQAQQLLPLKIQEAQMNAQEQGVRVQQGLQDLADRKAMDLAWRNSLTMDDNGQPTWDRTKLMQNLPGHLAGAAIENLNKIDKSRADLTEAQQKIQAASQEHLAGLGAQFEAFGYDPAAVKNQLEIEKHANPAWAEQATAAQAAIDQQLQQDPTGASAKAFIKQKADAMMAAGGPQFTQGRARKEAADVAAQRAPGEIAAQQAATDKAKAELQAKEIGDARAKYALNPPADAAALNAQLGQEKPYVAMALRSDLGTGPYDPAKVPDILNKAGMTAEQRYTAEHPKEGKLNDFDQFYKDFLQSKGVQDTAGARLQARKEWAQAGSSQTNVTIATPEQMQTTATQIAAGKIDPQTTRAMLRRNPGLIGQVLQADPNFDEAQIDKRYNVGKEFASSSNTKAGGQVIALNTLIHHADLYQQTAEALKNGTFRPGNAAYNAVASAFGSAPPTQANLVARFFAGETAKVATGGVPAEGEINGVLKNLGNSASPEQIAGAGQTLLQIAGGRMVPLMEKAKDAHLEGVYPVVGPDAREILTRRGFDPTTMKPVAQAGGAIPTPKSQAEFDALPKGARFNKPNDPKVYVKQ